VCSHEAFDLIEDVVAPMRLKKREEKRLLKQLTCPNCESRIPPGTLVATPTPEQSRQDRMSKKFDAHYWRDLESFRDSLIKHPMLGSEHPFGRLLSGIMKRAKKVLLEPRSWYRATTYSEDPHFEPLSQRESTRANRYNQIGQAAWYLAKNAETAAVEKLREPRDGEIIYIAQIGILEPIAVLDLRSVIWGEDPTGNWILRNVVDRRFLSEPTSNDQTRPEHRVPQFVGDLARRRGFRGILYDSTRPSPFNNPEAFGYNLVLFDPFPAHNIENHAAQSFDRTDVTAADFFAGTWERWRLRIVRDTNSSEEINTAGN